MKYMMLIVDDAGYWDSMSEKQRHEAFDRVGEWWGALVQKGTIVDGHQLQPAQTATTVKVNDGKGSVSDGALLVTDGPFSESKETIGGYGILSVADLDEAIAVVKTWPGNAKLEIRPIVEREGM
jgi:hypothetical protein